uniref:Uncharacterized protein n=1 Tax=Callorhinchus milii TaxID=7868 RepID=V9L651_CALMI
MASGTSLSGVNVVLVMAYGSLIFVLLFIFVKRQIMRFAMKSRRGPHVPIGHNAPKDLREYIDQSLLKVQSISYEPQLLPENEERQLYLQQQGGLACCNYVYRMRALDAIQHVALPAGDSEASGPHLPRKAFRTFLLLQRDSEPPYNEIRKNLVDWLLEGYDAARHGTGDFGELEYNRYQQALDELSDILRARGQGTPSQHQAAAKDLSSVAAATPSTIQVTYLPSTHRSKRPKHFLELKSFKDNYNTLESTL